MGNALSPCLFPNRRGGVVKLIFWGGEVRLLHGTWPAGQLLFDHPDHVVCPADSFFIGRPVHALALSDDLVAGQTYFVVPVDRLPQRALTVASISALSPVPAGRRDKSLLTFGGKDGPFEYMKDSLERTLIKVKPEFIAEILSEGVGKGDCGGSSSPLCTTPELQKHYEQLVGGKEQLWSPKLETISERKIRPSPGRILGFSTER